MTRLETPRTGSGPRNLSAEPTLAGILVCAEKGDNLGCEQKMKQYSRKTLKIKLLD